MDSTRDIAIGQVVMSKAGRDKGKLFLVQEIIDEQYLSVVDGNLRKLDNPKRKKIKHLIVYKAVLTDFQDKIVNNIKINDAYIRKLIEASKESF